MFSTIQTEEGFDVTRIGMTNWGLAAVVLIAGIAMSVAANIILERRKTGV